MAAKKHEDVTENMTDNEHLAGLLEQIADALDEQDANPSRIEAYRRGAETIRNHDEPIANIIREERFNDLTAIPTIGGGIASVLTEYVVDGRSKLLDDLHSDSTPEERSVASRGDDSEAANPPIDLLLELDAEYRQKADAGDLVTIAPRRNNPNNERWLPLMKTERDGWHFTALFSNTDTAHSLGRTHDWVVLYHERDGHEKQHTVVTEFQGPLHGKRVVRGRDEENQAYYEAREELGEREPTRG